MPSSTAVRPCAWVGLCLVVSTLARPAGAQVAELDLRNQFFYEPSSSSDMIVNTPGATLTVTPVDALQVSAGYSADIVSGATEAVKAGPQFRDTPDIVSHASITDFRHVGKGGISILRPHSKLGAAYSYGIENDYRSQTIEVSAGTDFLQRNTEIEIAYSHGFDDVCDVAVNAEQHPTRRLALDSSDGCFGDDDTRREVDVTLDNFHGAWTQSWTPVFATQLVLSAAIQSGLLGNPYRAVVIGPSGEAAQENHPQNRTRTAGAFRIKYFVRGIETAFGAGVRFYRDTWDVLGASYELDAERNLSSWLRLRVNGRFHTQTEANFWSDDYTGGEPLFGPRGQYFTGDRELSPLRNVLAGGRFVGTWHGRQGDRLGGMFMDLEASAGVDAMKTFLLDFTWAGNDPNDTLAIIVGANLTAAF